MTIQKYSVMIGSFTVVQDQLEVGLWEAGRPQTMSYFTCSVKELLAHPDTRPKDTIEKSLSRQRELLDAGQKHVLKEVVI